jgi:tetratricopeptide (TPR) repeat protein
VPLRLAIARGALGIELYEPVSLGPLEVNRLEFILPNLKFPVDLSGGIPAFRHRRGDLERVELRASLVALAAWLEHRFKNLLGPGTRRPSVWAVPDGLGIGLTTARSALAFELLWAPEDADARFVIAQVRGAAADAAAGEVGGSGTGLGAPALAFALRAVDAAFKGVGERSGRTLRIERAALRLGQALLPQFGARAPSADRVRFGLLDAEGDTLRVDLDATAPHPARSAEVVRAVELAELAREGDEALAANDLERARFAYLSALERAPRHPELVRLVAEIDLASGGRDEAALGLIVESQAATHAGIVGAELLARSGDLAGAREAVLEASRFESFAPVAALALVRLAAQEPQPRERFEALDQAVARAPALEAARWARFHARLDYRDIEGAIADAQHLEAAIRGSRARYDVCNRVAHAVREAGFPRHASGLFERALRYLPDDVDATTGLALSLLSLGRAERAVGLLERAVTLAERRGETAVEALVELAKLLARELTDVPGAIARVQQVPAGSARAVEARALEARWRAWLGDHAGASIAWGRMRETIELSRPACPEHATYLLEAATFEREVSSAPFDAERHLALALRLRPRDAELLRAFRDVHAIISAERRRHDGRAEVAPRAAEHAPAPQVPEVEPFEPAAVAASAAVAAPAPAPEIPQDPDVLEELVQRLESALRADPDNSDAALRLMLALERLGRDPELFALVSARLEDSSEAERVHVVPIAARVLERLENQAREQGSAEADLYASLRGAWLEPR